MSKIIYYDTFKTIESIKISQAIAFRSATTGEKISDIKKELASLMYPNSIGKSQYVYLSNLLNGKTKKIDKEMVQTICKVCMVDANFLFNI